MKMSVSKGGSCVLCVQTDTAPAGSTIDVCLVIWSSVTESVRHAELTAIGSAKSSTGENMFQAETDVLRSNISTRNCCKRIN